jgi:hypothetical protein
MNEGKVLKQLYSSDPQVAQLIENAVQKWIFGYCEHTTIYQSEQYEQDDKVFIEVSAQSDRASTETVIDAIMHIFCGFTLICLDYEDMECWLGHRNMFRTLTVKGKHKELPYEFWMALMDSISVHEKNGVEVKSVLITIIGNIDAIQHTEEIGLYAAMVKGLGIDVLINNCLFNDESLDTQLKVHLALQPQEQLELNNDMPECESTTCITDTDIPAFLRPRGKA